MKKNQKRIGLVMTAAIFCLTLAGCGQTPAGNSGAGNNSESAKLTGTVATDGSTSMEKVIGALGEALDRKSVV